MEITYDIERKCRDLIQHTCAVLDGEEFSKYLSSCEKDFSYAIRAYSPEIRKDMTWLEKDAKGLKDLFDIMPKQNRDRTPLTRHFVIQSIAAEDHEIVVRSALQVFRNSLDGGEVSLYAVGTYTDRIKIVGSEAKLRAREVRLETRSLGTGYHVPF